MSAERRVECPNCACQFTPGSVELKCEWCDALFETAGTLKRFCSRTCQQAQYVEARRSARSGVSMAEAVRIRRIARRRELLAQPDEPDDDGPEAA